MSARLACRAWAATLLLLALPPGASAGPGTAVNFGDFTQGAAGTLTVEVAGTAQGVPGGYDWLDVRFGRAILGGTLNITLLGGYVPAPGTQFIIITADAGVQGTFAQVNAPQLPDVRFTLAYGANDVRIAVTPAVASRQVPLPLGYQCTLALLLGGTALHAAKRRARLRAANSASAAVPNKPALGGNGTSDTPS